jgi:hypothetical protein
MLAMAQINEWMVNQIDLNYSSGGKHGHPFKYIENVCIAN